METKRLVPRESRFEKLASRLAKNRLALPSAPVSCFQPCSLVVLNFVQRAMPHTGPAESVRNRAAVTKP
jgi:hypothetical protein